jgi:hypothetical protein
MLHRTADRRDLRCRGMHADRPETGREPLERRVARVRREPASQAPKSAAGTDLRHAADMWPQTRVPAPSTRVAAAVSLRPDITEELIYSAFRVGVVRAGALVSPRSFRSWFLVRPLFLVPCQESRVHTTGG